MKIISIFGTLIGLLENDKNVQNNLTKFILNRESDNTKIDSIAEFFSLLSSAKIVFIKIESYNNGFEIASIISKTCPHINIITSTTSQKMNPGQLNSESKSLLPDHIGKVTSLLIEKRNLISNNKIWTINRTDLVLTDPDGHNYKMSPYEMVLLSLLAKNLGKIVYRQEIAQTMSIEWSKFDGRKLDQRVSRLRRRWKQLAGKELPIKTAHGQGYIFCEEIILI